MPGWRIVPVLACLAAVSPAPLSAQVRPAPAPAPRPMPPVTPIPNLIVPSPHPMPPVMPIPNLFLPPPPILVPAPGRRILPMPGRPGRFIICPGHRRCPALR